jgi:hypothetical protein
MAIHVDSPETIQEIVDSIKIRVTNFEEDAFFSKDDILNVLKRISHEITDDKQQEGFNLAIQFIERMGE